MSVLLLLGLVLLTQLAHRRVLGMFGDGVLQHLVRLPGNLLHELSHAVAMLITGYSVVGFRVSLFDPKGRGEVRPGPAWIGLARPWLTNLVSPVAPTAVGIVSLVLLHRWSGAPGIPTRVEGVLPVLSAVAWHRWQLWGGLLIGYSVAAELAPSRIDLAAWWRPAVVLGILLGGVGWAVEHRWPGEIVPALSALDGQVRGPLWAAIALALESLVLVGPVGLVLARLRR